MFRSSTILMELVQSLDKVTLLLIHSVKLRRRILFGDIYQSAQQTAYTPFHDMLPHLHTIYDLILLNVLTEV